MTIKNTKQKKYNKPLRHPKEPDETLMALAMLETISMRLVNMEMELHRVYESVIDSHVRDLEAEAVKKKLRIDSDEIDDALRELMDDGYLPHEMTIKDIQKKLKEAG